MNVLVLGCGPAGLLVTHAAALCGHDVKIVSKARKSRLYGCQYLHAAIPGVTGESQTVKYELRGSVEQYRKKVYGREYRGSVSPEELIGEHQAWNIRDAYDLLWDMYAEYIIQWTVFGPDDVTDVIKVSKPDVVLSTIPAPLLCRREDHHFPAATVWAIGDAPEEGQFCPVVAPESTVVCNGESEPAWYRAARVFGYTTAEWAKQPPYANAVPVAKPLQSNCDCYPEIIREGRYGLWEKGVLTSDAFHDALDKLSNG